MADTEPVDPAVSTAPVDEPNPAPVADDDSDPFETLEDLESYPKEVVERLRRENAKHRTAYQPYRDTFGSAAPEVQEYLLDLNRSLLNDPVAAAAELRELLERIEGVAPQAQVDAVKDAIDIADEAVDPSAIDEDQPLTLKQWKAIQSREAEREAAERGVEEIFQQAEALGYVRESPELSALFHLASTKYGGDLNKAHEEQVGKLEAAVNAKVEEQLAAIKSGAAKWPPVSVAGASPVEPKDEPKTLEDARARAKRRMERAFGG